MADRQDNEDLIFNRNLRDIGRHLTLPDEPTQQQEQTWKQREVDGGRFAGHRDRANFKRGKAFMKRHRIWTVTGSAIAATIAISSAIWIMPGQTPVSAATIFQSLREATTRGLTVWIDHVKQDGLEVDGRVHVSFGAGDENAAGGLDSDETGYAELRIHADENHPRVPGLEVELALSASPGQEWLYVKTHEVPMNLMAEEPFLGLLAAYTSSGVLLEMDGLVKRKGAQGESGADGAPPFRGGGLSFGFQVHSDESAPTEGASEGDAAKALELTSQFEWSSAPAAQDAFESGQAAGVDIESLKRAGVILESLFRGEMTPDQLTTVIDWIESSAGAVTVREQNGGAYLLTARDFDLSDLPLDDRSAAQVAGIELQILYRQDTGIQWAALRDVGEGHGSIRFELTTAGIDVTLHDRERFTKDDNVKVIDLNALSGLLGISSPN